MKLDMWGNSSIPLPTDPTTLERGLEQYWAPRALLGAVGIEGADTALLSGLLIQLLFPVEMGNLCIQGQEEAGEKILQCCGALYRERK